MQQAYLWLYKMILEHNHITVIMHNMSYDAQIMGLIDFVVRKRFYDLELKQVITSGIFYLKFQDKNRHRTIEFLDTYNYFKYSVEKMGQSLGLKKQIDDYSLTPTKWNNKLKDGMGKERVKLDTEILYKYFMRFINNDKFVIGLSLASTSFKTYRKKYQKLVISHPLDKIDSSLASYRGGRCEPYIINKEAIHLKSYDINSLYPFVLKHNKYSYKYHREINKIDFEAIEKNDYNYLYNVDYSYAEKPERLPIMVKSSDGMLTQSYSSNNVWLTGNEILAMYKQSDSILFRFHSGQEWHSDYLFTDFINDFYNMRLKADEIEGKMLKDVMNSNYGKWAQHKRQSQILALSDIDALTLSILMDIENENKRIINVNGITYNRHGDFFTVSKEMNKEAMYSPIIGSECTANARLVNFDYQQQIGFKHVYYTDTDSFFIDREWTTSKELGKLKLEKQGMFFIFDAKDYQYTDNKGIIYATHKGITKKAKKWNVELVDKYNQEHNTQYEEIYTQKQFSGFNTVGHNAISVIVKDVDKKIKREHRKLSYEKNNNGDYIGKPYEVLP